MTRRSRRPRVPRMRARGPWGAAITILVLVLLIVRAWQERDPAPPPEALAEESYAVEKVVDGDTLALANGARVRLIGANTPETVKPNHPVEPFGPEAKEFTARFVARGGHSVRLQFDRERKDRYDRFLAYVFVGDEMLNEELIRAGLARAETQYRFSASMKTRFQRAEDEARAARRGIWSR